MGEEPAGPDRGVGAAGADARYDSLELWRVRPVAPPQRERSACPRRGGRHRLRTVAVGSQLQACGLPPENRARHPNKIALRPHPLPYAW